MAKRIQNLSKDILNSASHVFGDHDKCEKYYCDIETDSSLNLVPGLRFSLEVRWHQYFHKKKKQADNCTTSTISEEIMAVGTFVSHC